MSEEPNEITETEPSNAEQLGKDLAAMDAHAREHHGSSLLADVIRRASGISLHPRTMKNEEGEPVAKIGA